MLYEYISVFHFSKVFIYFLSFFKFTICTNFENKLKKINMNSFENVLHIDYFTHFPHFPLPCVARNYSLSMSSSSSSVSSPSSSSSSPYFWFQLLNETICFSIESSSVISTSPLPPLPPEPLNIDSSCSNSSLRCFS